MRIAELTAWIIHVPLRREIKHASATRRESENLLVRCRLEDGTEGWGEGVPRAYVTGETAEGALEQLSATPLGDQLGRPCGSWPDVIELCSAFQPRCDKEDPRDHHSNALRCAVELSMLDAYGRLFGQPVREVVRCYEPARELYLSREQVRYSTTITAEDPGRERLNALKMRVYGFQQCKVKVGVAGADDAARLRRIRFWIGRRMDLRLDANEAWRADEVIDRLTPLLRHNVSCVEQPVAHEEVDALAALRPKLTAPIMLDESLTSLPDAEAAVRQGTCDLFNIRLSKCGGFINSLRLAVLAHAAGLGYQLGCHPGESGVLSAAGRQWATAVRGIRYLEGSYDRHLLRERLTREDITFGYGGRAPALPGPGLGITIEPRVLARLKTHEINFRWG
jgi:L-Ala-D/L-Glu epimerase